MKKVILSIAIIAVSFAASAQTEKGTWLLGGNAAFTSSKVSGGDAQTNVNFSPNAGYFVAENVAVGALLDITSVKDSYSSFSISPFARYYFLPLGDNAKLFGQGSFGFGSYKPEGGDSQSATTWGLQAGPAFFLNKNIALEATVGYGSMKAKDSDAVNTFGLNIGFQIHLGGK